METFTIADEMAFAVERVVRQGGVHVYYVFGDEHRPSWAYSIGCLEHGHPELVAVGLSAPSARSFIGHIFDHVIAGTAPPIGRVHRDECEGKAISLVELVDEQWHPPSDLVLGLLGYYGARGGFPVDPRVCQLVWCDEQGRLPWDRGFDDSLRKFQPLLDAQPWVTPEGSDRCDDPACECHGRDDLV